MSFNERSRRIYGETKREMELVKVLMEVWSRAWISVGLGKKKVDGIFNSFGLFCLFY